MTSTTQRDNHERHCDTAEDHIQLGEFEAALAELNRAREALHEAGGTARCEYMVALCLLELGHDASGPLQEAQRLFFKSEAADVNPDHEKESLADALLGNIRTLQVRVTLHEAEALIAQMREGGDMELAAEAADKLGGILESDRLSEHEQAFATGLAAYCRWLTADEKSNAQQSLFAARRVLKRYGAFNLELVIIDLLLDTHLARRQALYLAIREIRLKRWTAGMSNGLQALAGFSLR